MPIKLFILYKQITYSVVLSSLLLIINYICITQSTLISILITFSVSLFACKYRLICPIPIILFYEPFLGQFVGGGVGGSVAALSQKLRKFVWKAFAFISPIKNIFVMLMMIKVLKEWKFWRNGVKPYLTWNA